MNIQFTIPQTVFFISILFILISSTLSALAIIFEDRKKQIDGVEFDIDILELIRKIRSLSLIIALILLLLSFILYRKL